MIAIVGSPPYADGLGHDTGHPRLDAIEDRRREIEGSARRNGYGATPGQLAALPAGEVAGLAELENDMIDNWNGCYDNGWKGLITDAAFAHPAKFSHGLIRRIFQHLLDEALVKPGDVVLDPFGGVGLGAIYALQNGLNWIGVELESKFVELGQANIDLWNTRYAAHFPRWGSARLLQGDSRRLAEIVAAAGCVVSSPPYAESLQANRSDASVEGDRKHRLTIGRNPNSGGSLPMASYGSTPGQLAALPPGSVEAVISSPPPFAGNTGGRGEASRNGIDAALFDRHSGGMKKGTGSDPANLDNLRMGAVVGSPPFENSIASGGKNHTGVRPPHDTTGFVFTDYGDSPANIGNDSGETFWTAARLILEQCALLLPPGAPAVWVLKDYVKGGKIVPFAAQWQALCEACGFETIHVHRAWLVKRNGTQATMANGYDTSANMTNLLGEDVAKEGTALANRSLDVERYSFFRRLHIKKNPHLAVEWETVLCTRKK